MRGILVLWDVDHTLIDVDGLGREAYDLAFERLFGRRPVSRPLMSGRTDRAIAVDLLRTNGVAEPERHLEALREATETAFDELAPLLATRARTLPGAAASIAALAALPAPPVQSLLTGNVRRLAERKLAPFGLTEHLDLDAGAYGWSDTVRGHLVDLARTAAGARHGHAFGGRATVLVGDTPLDVEAALHAGAGVVAVATGVYSVEELAAAGAHAVLPSLAEPTATVAALRSAADLES